MTKKDANVSKFGLMVCFLCTPLLGANVAFGADHVWIDDPSALKWQLYSDGKAYFRNLDEFPDGAYPNNFEGCCTRYWVDTTTEGGEALWAQIQLHVATNRPFYISKQTAAVDGHIHYVGVW